MSTVFKTGPTRWLNQVRPWTGYGVGLSLKTIEVNKNHKNHQKSVNKPYKQKLVYIYKVLYWLFIYILVMYQIYKHYFKIHILKVYWTKLLNQVWPHRTVTYIIFRYNFRSSFKNIDYKKCDSNSYFPV